MKQLSDKDKQMKKRNPSFFWSLPIFISGVTLLDGAIMLNTKLSPGAVICINLGLTFMILGCMLLFDEYKKVNK
jgi:hypothetical protein